VNPVVLVHHILAGHHQRPGGVEPEAEPQVRHGIPGRAAGRNSLGVLPVGSGQPVFARRGTAERLRPETAVVTLPPESRVDRQRQGPHRLADPSSAGTVSVGVTLDPREAVAPEPAAAEPHVQLAFDTVHVAVAAVDLGVSPAAGGLPDDHVADARVEIGDMPRHGIGRDARSDLAAHEGFRIEVRRRRFDVCAAADIETRQV